MAALAGARLLRRDELLASELSSASLSARVRQVATLSLFFFLALFLCVVLFFLAESALELDSLSDSELLRVASSSEKDPEELSSPPLILPADMVSSTYSESPESDPFSWSLTSPASLSLLSPGTFASCSLSSS